MRLMNLTKKKVVAFGLAFGVAAGAGGIAAAYFSSPPSSGTGSGGISTLTKFTITWSGGNEGTTLSPQLAATPAPMTMGFTVHNPGAIAERLNTATAKVNANKTGTIVTATSVYTGHTYIAGCKASWFTVTVTTKGTAGYGGFSPVPTMIKGGGTATIAVVAKLITSGTTQSACAGSHISVTLTGN